MTVKQRLSRSNIYMFLIPLLIAAALLLVGAGIALYVLETVYLPKIGLSLQEMHITLEQYESMFAKFEVFLWVYLGAVGMALLLFLARHPNQVFSREDLYELIWGLESMGDNITVAVHVNRLREKVEENPSKPQLIQTVWGVGYRLNTL